MKRFYLFLSFIAFLVSCGDAPPADIRQPDPVQVQFPVMTEKQMYALIAEGEQQLKDGDLVVRRGRDMISHIIRQFNRTDHFYSHAGIAFIENGRPFIYHIYPDDSVKGSQLFRDSLTRFADPSRNDGFGIYRYRLKPEELSSFKSQILAYYKKGVRFDRQFDQRTDQEMYCSEMIRKVLLKATSGKISIAEVKLTPQEIDFFSKRLQIPASEGDNRRIVSIDNLYLHPLCDSVNRFVFDTVSMR